MNQFVPLFIILVWIAAAPAVGQTACTAPDAVCAARTGVFRISAFDPEASAVLIEPGLLVTNRHAIANAGQARIIRPDGSHLTADVVPTSYDGDLVLLRAPGLAAPVIPLAPAPTKTNELYTVAADVGRQAIRVYRLGHPLALPANGQPLARLHHTARSQPGNSGGALVDAHGRLVGIVTSGGSGRHEAIPASEISRLKSLSGPGHVQANARIGLAYRQCIAALVAARANRQPLADNNVAFMSERCGASTNRQLMDLAGQALGRRGHHDEAVSLFESALGQDPNAVNTRLSLVVTLHLAQRFEAELPHLRNLIKVLPRDVQVLRFAIQAGTWGKDPALAGQGITLLKRHHPKLAPLAERFLSQPPPRRRPR